MSDGDPKTTPKSTLFSDTGHPPKSSICRASVNIDFQVTEPQLTFPRPAHPTRWSRSRKWTCTLWLDGHLPKSLIISSRLCGPSIHQAHEHKLRHSSPSFRTMLEFRDCTYFFSDWIHLNK